MQTNNHLSGVNLLNPYCQSLIQNTSTSFYAVVYFRAHRVSLGFFCDSTSKEIKKHISLLTLSSLYPKTKFRKSLRYFQFLFQFINISLYKKLMVSQVPRSANLQFSNTQRKRTAIPSYTFRLLHYLQNRMSSVLYF